MTNKPDVLIVEDESIIALSLKMMVEEIGLSAEIVRSGEAAIEKSDQHKPELILMDIALDGALSGIDAAAAISENKIPIIFVTAFHNKEALLKAKLTEDFAYLIKPIIKEDLQQEVRKILLKKKENKSPNFS